MICPFATWHEFAAPSGTYVEASFRIVHHTTEIATAQATFDAYASNRSQPHFTVDAANIFQHIDTDFSARSLRNAPGGVQTNRLSAIQIEVVGFAHLPKGPFTLLNVARLCRWIEETHSIPRFWPNGYPVVAIDGGDPGGSNRDVATWLTQGGHYGHCHVPENDHWDPGYTPDEVAFLMDTEFDESQAPAFKESALFARLPLLDPATLSAAASTMPDHAAIDGEL